MIRRIALTLGLGVAVMTAGSRTAPSLTAVDTFSAFAAPTGVKSAAPNTPRRPHRSGYIVASS